MILKVSKQNASIRLVVDVWLIKPY